MSMTATDRLACDIIRTCLDRSIGYGEALLKDIPADTFALMPHPTMNHPAFVVGHLSLYPHRMFRIIGRQDLVRERPGYEDLFKAGAPCLDDPARYPSKDDLVPYFLEGYRSLSTALETLSDDVLARENPMEGRMRELFPTIGKALNFMANNHVMMHLGQISAWRRAVGLPSAM